MNYLRWRIFWGHVASLSGCPGFVRPCEYLGLGVAVTVRVSTLFTVVSVNGIDVYFYRLTGGIDGVGFVPPASPSEDL